MKQQKRQELTCRRRKGNESHALMRKAIDTEIRLRAKLGMVKGSEEGQGTTEYAILVGVLAVIAMIAIAAFSGALGDLWDAISNGVNDMSSQNG